MWWCNERAKDTVAKKKAAFEELCRFPSEDNDTQYKCIRNQAKKVVARSVRKEAEQMLYNL